jgi:hypothetical protein
VLSKSALTGIGATILIVAIILILTAVSAASAFAAPADDSCTLLTQAQVSAALGIAMGAGQHISAGSSICGWYEPGSSVSSPNGKKALLDLYAPMGGLSPVDRFNNAKTPIKGITKTPVTGIGDEAIFVATPGIGTALIVRKGSSVFQIRVAGFSAEQIQSMEKAIAQNVVARL